MHATRPRTRHALTVAIGFAGIPCGRCSAPGDASTVADARATLPDAASVTVPWPVLPFPAIAFPVDNPSTPAKIELGRMLFHDPVLSSDRHVACVTCHSQYWGLGDGLAHAIGTGGIGPAGPGRTGGSPTRRNALTLWNAAFRPALFWDGRVGSLEAQVAVPLGDAHELGLAPADAVGALDAIPAYRSLFANAFPDETAPLNEANLARAIASFVRTLVSDRAPYDRFVRGDQAALSSAEIDGMQRFAAAGCEHCHAAPRFEDDDYHDAHVTDALAVDDPGRAGMTNRLEDRGRFRTPTLRNLRETGPYFHDGSSTTIEDAVARMDRATHDVPVLDAAGVSAIATFLRKSLVDRSRDPIRPDSVPSGLSAAPDGLRIPR